MASKASSKAAAKNAIQFELHATVHRAHHHAAAAPAVHHSHVGLVYDERCLKHKGPDEHPERPARAAEIVKLLRGEGVFDRCQLVASRPATVAELSLTHTPAHIDSVKNLSKFKNSRGYQFANGIEDTYACQETAFLAELACGGLTDLLDQVVAGSLASGAAVIRPPGHHAECEKVMGFCFYNNVAVAINAVRKTHPTLTRIAIVDWDVHHGNGSQDTFYADPQACESVCRAS